MNEAQRSERNVKAQRRKFDDFKPEENLRSCAESERNKVKRTKAQGIKSADLTILNQRKIFALDMRVNEAQRSERNVKAQWRKFDDFKSEENFHP